MSDERVTVVCGEWLIFDHFDGWHDAARFVAWVEAEYPGRDCRSIEVAAVANQMTLYPFELTPPVVLVARDEGWTDEGTLEGAVGGFGGRFAGT